MENHVFFGPPTLNEIIIYLMDKKYSLINNPFLKYQIISRNRCEKKIFFGKNCFELGRFFEVSNIYTKKFFMFANEALRQRSRSVPLLGCNKQDRKAITLYCKKDIHGCIAAQMNKRMECATQKQFSEVNVILKASPKNNDIQENTVKIGQNKLLAEKSGDENKNKIRQQNVGMITDKLKATERPILQENQNGCRQLKYNSKKIKKVFNHKMKQETPVLSQKRIKKDACRSVLCDITNTENKDASINNLKCSTDTSCLVPVKNELNNAETIDDKRKKYSKLREITAKNTRFNSGYKTVILKHTKQINFLYGNKTEHDKKTKRSKKRKIVVSFKQKEHIPPHNTGEIKSILVNNPQIKKRGISGCKTVIELKRYVSVDFKPSRFKFEKKNKINQ